MRPASTLTPRSARGLSVVVLALVGFGCSSKKDAGNSKPHRNQSPGALEDATEVAPSSAPFTAVAVARSDASIHRGASDASIPHGASNAARAAERRLEPKNGLNPTHATIRLLRKIGAGEWQLDGLISDERGLVYIEEMDGPRIAKRYCGPELPRALAEAGKAFAAVRERIEREGARSASCSNEPRPPRCRTTELGHEGAYFFRFADGSRGIELAAVYHVSLGALGTLEGRALIEFEESTIARADKAMLRLSAMPCAGAH